MRGVLRGLLQRRHDHVLDPVQQDRRRPARPRLVGQPVQPQLREPPAPLGHGARRHPQVRGDLLVRGALRAGQHDPGPQRQACELFARRDQAASWSRSASVSTSPAFGRPGRSPSARPPSRSPANRLRHLTTVSVVVPSPAATRSCDIPGSAQASTIRARSARRGGGARAHRASSSRSPSVSTSTAAECDIRTV